MRHFSAGVRVKIGQKGIIKKGLYTIKSMQVEFLQDVQYANGNTTSDVDVKAKFSVSQELINKFIAEKLLFITINNGLRRNVSVEECQREKAITDLLLDCGDNQDSEKEQQDIFGSKYFDYAKPTKLLYNLIKSSTENCDIILDFFAGSGTTAHAVMQLNAEDGGNRKFICVQLPEATNEKSEAKRAGFDTIAQITKERIRRAGVKIQDELSVKCKKIAEQLPLDGQDSRITNENGQSIRTNNLANNLTNNLDTGFRIYKIGESNFKQWRGNIVDADDLLAQLEEHVNPIANDDYNEILTELLFKAGISPVLQEVQKVEDSIYSTQSMDSKTIFVLSNNFSKNSWDNVIALKPNKIVVLDRCFTVNGVGDDNLKANCLFTTEQSEPAIMVEVI